MAASKRLTHFTLDGFHGFRSRFDDIKLVQEILEELPSVLGLKPVMPPFLLPSWRATPVIVFSMLIFQRAMRS